MTASTTGAELDLAALEAVAQAINAAEVGYRMRLMRLVDGVSTYSLVYDDGERHEFDSTEDVYAHVAQKKSEAQARAAIAAYQPALLDALEAALERANAAEAGAAERCIQAEALAAGKDRMCFELFTACGQIAEVFGLEMPLHPADADENLAAKVRHAKLTAVRELEAEREKVTRLRAALLAIRAKMREEVEVEDEEDGPVMVGLDEETQLRDIENILSRTLADTAPSDNAGTGGTRGD